MFSSIIISAALLSATTVFAAPTPASAPPSAPRPRQSSKTVLLPLYVNGADVSKTSFSTPSNLSDPNSPPTPPNTYTHVESNVNVTIVRQEEAAPLFHIPSQDAQLFAAFAKSAYATSSNNQQSSSSLPNNKLDIGAKLTGEEAGDHTVHITMVQDPNTATGPFTYAAGSVVVNALQDWSRLWAAGSFVGCAGVLVQDGSNAVAQGSFCGASTSTSS